MVKRTVNFEKNKFIVEYNLKPDHTVALFLVKNNNGMAQFEQRSEKKQNDIDGLEISWKTCDELVEMGLLEEDFEEYNVVFNITELGKELLTKVK